MIKILTPLRVHPCILWVFAFFLLLCYNLLVVCGQICFPEQHKLRFACILWVDLFSFQLCLGYVNWNKFLNNRNEICFLVLLVF
jgi:hypothetical protein